MELGGGGVGGSGVRQVVVRCGLEREQRLSLKSQLVRGQRLV